MAKGNSQKMANGYALQFEAQLWAAAEQAVPAPNYPPFNMSDWSRGGGMRQDVRWKFGMPPGNNANYAWIQHFIHHLSPVGVAGFVMANGSMSTQTSNEGEIRKALIEADLVDCMVALPGQISYNYALN